MYSSSSSSSSIITTIIINIIIITITVVIIITNVSRNLRFRIASRGQRTTLGKVLEKQRLLIIIEKETSPQIQSNFCNNSKNNNDDKSNNNNNQGVPSAESPVGRLTVSLACDAVGVDSL